MSEDHEELVRPTSELKEFIKLIEEADEFTKSQLSGIISLSPKPRWFMYKSILIIKTWKEVVLKYLKNVRDRYDVMHFMKYFISQTKRLVGLSLEQQIKVLSETLTFLEFRFRTSPVSISVVKTGFIWFISQKLELVYNLQGWIGRRRPLIERTGVGEGERTTT